MKELDETLRYLESEEALQAIERDPYWPKWDGPWWRMVLLREMGMARLIPRACIDATMRAIDRRCLHFFPFRIEEVPRGVDPIRGIPCHCQLGTLYQLLHACGVDVDRELPWIRPWFLKYQLPDGGLNCDEAAYTKPEPHSSVVSTLPPLEAVLFCTRRDFTREERSFLDRGAEYLVQRRLFRSKRTGAAIDESWLRPAFPRFYFYDVLRGLRLAARLGIESPEAMEVAASAEPVRRDLGGTATWIFEEGEWKKGPARSFPLLDAADPGILRKERDEVLAAIARIDPRETPRSA
ncbi:MAG: hypothetical protein HYY17_03010 [Planctomycetes bacterium]|nr:hypothetical protein [Planctomycetota bacterium]